MIPRQASRPPVIARQEMRHVRCPGESLNLATPIRFNPELPRWLLAMHEALNARFATVLNRLSTNPSSAIDTLHACVTLLQELRRAETVRLYPFIAAGLNEDKLARNQLMQLRISLLAGLRTTLRHLDDLCRAVAEGTMFTEQAERASISLAAYLHRSETEIYPLYTVIGMHQIAARVA